MDSRSPRLRLSVLGLLLEAGFTPDKVGSEEWTAFLEDIVDYLGDGLDDWANDMAKLEVPEEEGDKDDKLPGTEKDAYRILGDGYM
jgi:hypothetical protein